MPRDGGGVFSLDAGYLAVAGQTIQPSQHNPPLEDLASAMTDSISRTGVTAVTADLPFGGFRLTNVGDATADTDALNRQTADDRYDDRYYAKGSVGLPIGTPVPVLTNTLPDLCIWADGRNVSRTTYADLFTEFGTTFGAGDGSTTFGMPDLRGRPLVGRDNLGGTDAGRLTSAPAIVNTRLTTGGVVGANTHALSSGENAAHAHGGTTDSGSPNSPAYVLYGSNTTAQSGFGVSVPDAGSITTAQVSGSLFHVHNYTTSSSGSGTAHNNVQQSFLCNFAIFAGV